MKYPQHKFLMIKVHKKQQILTEQNTSLMNKRQYTTLTSQGKQHIFKGQQSVIKQPQTALSQKQNKFLQHFKSINNVDPITNLYARPTNLNEDHEALYMTKLQSYAQSKISPIERIIRSNDDENSIKPVRNDIKISPALPLIHVKPQIKRNVQRINDFFSIEEPKLSIDEKKQQQELFHTQILEISVYSEILKSLPSKPKQQLKPQLPNFYSIYNTPTQRPIYDYQSPPTKMAFNNMNETERYMHSTPDRFGSIQLNPTQKPPQIGNPTQPEIKFRKADMLLVEILRQKKRKGLVPDYFKIMELKLFELLDFILQDQPEFDGLSSIQKMKQVLKKLQHFKGKKIEGQNKINLLKIFFEEFRNLKHQNSESEKKKPLQKVQNKPKPPTHKQQQPKEVKEADKKGSQNALKKLPYKDAVSVNGDKKPKGSFSQASKSVKGMQDEWMGDLQ